MRMESVDSVTVCYRKRNKQSWLRSEQRAGEDSTCCVGRPCGTDRGRGEQEVFVSAVSFEDDSAL